MFKLSTTIFIEHSCAPINLFLFAVMHANWKFATTADVIAFFAQNLLFHSIFFARMKSKKMEKIMNFCCSFHIHHKLNLKDNKNIFGWFLVRIKRLSQCVLVILTLHWPFFVTFLLICCGFFRNWEHLFARIYMNLD